MIAKAALVASSLFGDLIRDGLRFAGGVVVALLVPVILVVVIVAMFIAAPFAAFGGGDGGGGSDPPPVPLDHLAVMVEVGQGNGVPWSLLAAIASVESGFGANMATSWAGAIGYGQFMPPSWAAFGEGGDPYDYRDVIPAMARYLLAADVQRDVPGAVYAYNHSWEYVALVLGRMAYYQAAFGELAAELGAPSPAPSPTPAVPS
ncbi:MAG: lytic transglycosylase domain-containing protein [Dehalococcoidia bacterium]|nr:MAG: lytic transglycosylase domain-containing protein [Dehalococcoidia bacterium]